MRVINNPPADGAEIQSDWEWSSAPEVISHRSYHEMSDEPVVEMDALTLLNVQMDVLEDLQGRFSFIMREVRYLMKV